MKCDKCGLPLDTQYGCTCPPNKSIQPPKVVYVDDSEEYVRFEENLTWFLGGVLVTLIGFGVFL